MTSSPAALTRLYYYFVYNVPESVFKRRLNSSGTIENYTQKKKGAKETIEKNNDSLNILLRSMPPMKQKRLRVKPLIECNNVFSQKQQAFLDAPAHRINILDGAVRSGKTYISLFKWVQIAKRAPINQNLMMVN